MGSDCMSSFLIIAYLFTLQVLTRTKYLVNNAFCQINEF